MTVSCAPLDAAGTARHLSFAGIQIGYHLINGEMGGVPVIFTHGGGPGSGAWNNFLYNAAAFSKQFRCYFYDLPGFGGSDKVPAQGPVYSWHANKLLGFMDALQIDKAYLVNQSFGGSAAIKLAAQAPGRVAKLVITGSQPVLGSIVTPSSSSRARQLVGDYFAGEGPSLEKMRRIVTELEFFDPSKVTDLNIQLRHQAGAQPDARRLAEVPNWRGAPENLVRELDQVAAPTLIVHGLHDAFAGVDVPLFMTNRMADSRLHIIRNAAHHVQTECPAEYNEIVLGFLNRERV
jgi:2-hydroxy-6-oxonona-2,4-dienedioate hydrolase